MTKKYPYYKTIPHWFALRFIVASPFAITYFISKFIAEQLEKFIDTLDHILPQAYREELAEFDKLPKHMQKEIERIAKARDTTKERIMFQTQKAQ